MSGSVWSHEVSTFSHIWRGHKTGRMFWTKYDSKELAEWLNLNRLPPAICDAMKDNNINGATFHRLRRGDLNDLFPETFLLRKELADFLEDLRSGELDHTPLPTPTTDHLWHEILVEMQLLTSCREEDFITNWRESKERLLTNVSTFPEQAEAGEQCEIPDDEDGALMIRLSTVFGCEPLFYFIDKGEEPENFAKGRTSNSLNSSQPWVMWSVDNVDDDTVQSFIVVDRQILCEIEAVSGSFLHALFVLLATHYAFNIAYKKSQLLLYTFLEEFFLGITPKKKSQKYRNIVNQLYEY